MSLILRSAAGTDVGMVRANNEDAVYAGRYLVAVADGVGGLPSGELASGIAIRALIGLDDAPPHGDPLDALGDAIDRANEEIHDAGRADEAHGGMGTTVTALLLTGDQLGLLHVGDSRCYLLRAGALSQLSRDDTFVQSLVDQGVLTVEEARQHPQRSLITQALFGRELRASCAIVASQPGDRFLLCSDGLSDVVEPEEIERELRSHPEPAECVAALVKLALRAGGPDNITVVVADLTEE